MSGVPLTILLTSIVNYSWRVIFWTRPAETCLSAPKICSSAPSNSSNENSGQPFSHRRFDRAEQPNKLHPFIFRRMSKGTAPRRATVVGHCIRQRTHNQSALSVIDHDLVFVDRHVPWSL